MFSLVICNKLIVNWLGKKKIFGQVRFNQKMMSAGQLAPGR